MGRGGLRLGVGERSQGHSCLTLYKTLINGKMVVLRNVRELVNVSLVSFLGGVLVVLKLLPTPVIVMHF